MTGLWAMVMVCGSELQVADAWSGWEQPVALSGARSSDHQNNPRVGVTK